MLINNIDDLRKDNESLLKANNELSKENLRLKKMIYELIETYNKGKKTNIEIIKRIMEELQ